MAIDVGSVWIVARLERLEILKSLTINTNKLVTLRHQIGVTGITLYVINEDATLQVRSFAPAQGVIEDPVCGSGNAYVAVHLKATNQQQRVGQTYTAYQGEALGRDGQVRVRFKGDDVYIGGMAVTVINGEISV